MEVSSVLELCQHLISSAIQRCRKAGDLCRLSVVLRSSPLSNPPLAQISVSDTGIGSCLEEFQCLKYSMDPSSAEKWDGVITLTTTDITDDVIHNYHLNLKEIVLSTSLRKLPSSSKNGRKFSGTEASLFISGSVDELLKELTYYLKKMLILKIPNIAVELVVDFGGVAGSQCENLISTNDSFAFPCAASSIECLRSGFEDYVLKHGNSLNDICHSCFSNGVHVKVGSAVACSTESHRNTGQVMEAVIIISELSEPTTPSCIRTSNGKTKVLYFKDFSPCLVSHSSLSGLTSINWKNYGLSLKSFADQDGCALLEWENLPPVIHIDIALHCYHNQVMMPQATQQNRLERILTQKAVKLALNNLKEKNSGALLSTRALKICSYAPDLARTIAGLILSSDDSNFQGECFSLLGFQHQEIEGKTVEDCIKGKIISAIEVNDRKPRGIQEAAPFLFKDNYLQEPDVLEEEYEEDIEPFSSLDL